MAKFTVIPQDMFNELQVDASVMDTIPNSQIEYYNGNNFYGEDMKVIKEIRCCGNCAYYDGDWPYKICCKDKAHRKGMSGNMGTKVCEDHRFGKWDRYNDEPVFIKL